MSSIIISRPYISNIDQYRYATIQITKKDYDRLFRTVVKPYSDSNGVKCSYLKPNLFNTISEETTKGKVELQVLLFSSPSDKVSKDFSMQFVMVNAPSTIYKNPIAEREIYSPVSRATVSRIWSVLAAFNFNLRDHFNGNYELTVGLDTGITFGTRTIPKTTSELFHYFTEVFTSLLQSLELEGELPSLEKSVDKDDFVVIAIDTGR